MTQHQFFQSFGIPNNTGVGIYTNETISHNEMVMELYNNWKSVKWLLISLNEGFKTVVDSMENDWVLFINKNGINIESFKTPEEFFEKHILT